MADCHTQARYVPRTTQDCDALALVREEVAVREHDVGPGCDVAITGIVRLPAYGGSVELLFVALSATAREVRVSGTSDPRWCPTAVLRRSLLIALIATGCAPTGTRDEQPPTPQSANPTSVAPGNPLLAIGNWRAPVSGWSQWLAVYEDTKTASSS